MILLFLSSNTNENVIILLLMIPGKIYECISANPSSLNFAVSTSKRAPISFFASNSWSQILRALLIEWDHSISLQPGFCITSASTNASNRGDDPSENEIRHKHKHTSNPSQLSKLVRREVIWIQCFHWPKWQYPGSCVMPERYFIFSCCSANASISASIKRNNFYPTVCACSCAYACVEVVCFHVEISFCLYTLEKIWIYKTSVMNLSYQI